MEKIKFSELVHFTPRQHEARALVAQNKFVFYGGAMGGGKSYWLRWQLLELLLRVYAKYNLKNVIAALFCEDYPSLKDRHISKIKMEFPDWLGSFNASDHNFILHPEFGSGVLAFRNLDDPSKYQSAEFAFQGVDEITKNQEETFHFLRTRLRWPGVKNVKFLAASNPGGIGHEWVKRKFINGIHEANEREKEQFVYIPAKASDNPHLDPSYLQSLEGLPADMRKAFLDGNWDIFKGQYFKEWNRDLHVIEPFEIVHMLDNTLATYFIALDYGYDKPSAVYWICKNRDNIVYAYRELYENGLTFENLTKMIVAMTPEINKIDYVVADPSIWARRGETELSGAGIIETIWNERVKLNPIRLIKGDNNRLSGWGILRDHLKPILYKGKTQGKLQVFSTCANLIRTLPALVYDDSRVEDCDTDGEDHGPDAIRYGLMTNPKNKADDARSLYTQTRIIEDAKRLNLKNTFR